MKRVAVGSGVLLAILLIVGFRTRPAGETRGPVPRARPSGSPTVDEGAAPSEPERRILIRTREGAGVPARVRIAVSMDRFRSFEIVEAETDASGRLAISVQPGAWAMIHARAEGFEPVSHGPMDWADAPLTLEMRPAALRGGRILVRDGRPWVGGRIRLHPRFPQGTFAGVAASRLGLVDEEARTDAQGGFYCTSLRSGAYMISFPDHPSWPTVVVPPGAWERGLDLTLPWSEEN